MISYLCQNLPSLRRIKQLSFIGSKITMYRKVHLPNNVTLSMTTNSVVSEFLFQQLSELICMHNVTKICLPNSCHCYICGKRCSKHKVI